MKILHTSDWHIGQKLYGHDREEEHQRFFEWLRQEMIDQQVECLLVCGDIFDTGYPSNNSLKLYYRFLTSLIGTSCRQVLITGGNHDSVSTLEAPKDVLEFLNVKVIGGVPENKAEQIVELKNEGGQCEAVVLAIPFLRDRNIREPAVGEGYEDKIQAIRNGILAHYKYLFELTQHYRDQKIPIIATGHLFVQGGQVSDSEREIQIGNLAAVASGDFPPFDYLALGHLHRPQIISKNPLTIYSGSPIPLSFSEIMYSKRVNLVKTGFPEIEIQPVEVPLFRKLVKIEGTMQEIKARLHELQQHGNLPVWIDLQVVEEETDPLLLRLFDDFNEDFNHDHSEKQIIKHTIRFLSRLTEGSGMANEERTLNDLGEKQVFEKLLQQQGITDSADLLQSFGELLEMVHQENSL